jgi:hypothetical protein
VIFRAAHVVGVAGRGRAGWHDRAVSASSPARDAQRRRAGETVQDAVLARITYANEETGHRIARVTTDRSGSDLVTVVGALLRVQPGVLPPHSNTQRLTAHASVAPRGFLSGHPQHHPHGLGDGGRPAARSWGEG